MKSKLIIFNLLAFSVLNANIQQASSEEKAIFENKYLKADTNIDIQNNSKVDINNTISKNDLKGKINDIDPKSIESITNTNKNDLNTNTSDLKAIIYNKRN